MLARFVNSLPTALSQQITKLYFRALSASRRSPHSAEQSVSLGAMEVVVLPALEDNYMYLVVDADSKMAAAVDPVDPLAVLRAVEGRGLQLAAVLTTHHHWDHAGGNEELARLRPAVPVYAGDARVPARTLAVAHGDVLPLGALSVRCLTTPCHTSGHICYHVTAPGDSDGAVFTGDTLFVGGCGRFFEGTAAQMCAALLDTLGSLPSAARVFCGHEYSLQNLRYALHVEPNNEDARRKLDWAQQQRDRGEPTVPSTIGEERLYNPFMRVGEAQVQRHASAHDALSTMHALRAEKDNFKG